MAALVKLFEFMLLMPFNFVFCHRQKLQNKEQGALGVLTVFGKHNSEYVGYIAYDMLDWNCFTSCIPS